MLRMARLSKASKELIHHQEGKKKTYKMVLGIKSIDKRIVSRFKISFIFIFFQTLVGL